MPEAAALPHAREPQTERSSAWPESLDLASISHDMKSPLCAIALYNDLLQGLERDAPERALYHESISVQVQRLANLADMLVAQGGRPQVLLRQQGVSLRELLESTVRLHAGLHGRQGYVFQLSIPRALPYLFADRAALARVLDNLLENAVKYSEPHQIVLRAFEHRRQGGVYVALEIQDQGSGIPPQHWQHLFEPYYRAGHNGPGTGLGLSIVRRLVEAHEGRIEVDSTPGGGTTFRVLLPVEQTTHGTPHSISLKRHVYNQQQ